VYLGQYAAAAAGSFIEPSGPGIGGLAEPLGLDGTICRARLSARQVVTQADETKIAANDAAGLAVPEIGDFLASMMACGGSSRSARSYALALLRWWRFLAAIEVDWSRAGRVEVRDFVLWMRFVAQPKYSISGDTAGYAPATINHNLAVLKSFYGDRIDTGRGPLVNPVPDADHRPGRRSSAHHNPMRPHDAGHRAPLRQKVPDRIPRALPDRLFDALFAVAGCDRDRALLAFYVSTGARASELLGVSIDLVDPGTQRIAVRRKGSERTLADGVGGLVRVAAPVSAASDTAGGGASVVVDPSQSARRIDVFGGSADVAAREHGAGHEVDVARSSPHGGAADDRRSAAVAH
jgi:hypothetical protein